MAGRTKDSAETELRTLFEGGTVVGRSDGELLDLFLRADGPAAELAFAALVEWHGPMVWRVCLDVLRESNHADDAFQATFVILARRAGAIRRRSSLGPWLYGVAFRVSRSARSRAVRRTNREQVAAEPEREEFMAEVDRLDLAPIVHEEVGRLPEKYREPLVLCYFQGLTHDQAASQLGWPVGTVRSRLAKARDRLRPRLLRRGVAPSVAILLATGRMEAVAAVPPALISSTVGMAVGSGAVGTVPAAVAALVGTTLKEMTILKTSMIATSLVAVALASAAGVGYVAYEAGTRAVEKAVTPGPNAPTAKLEAAASRTSVQTVQPRAITITQDYVCQIHASRRIDIRALDKGYLAAIPIREGQAVKQGDLLFQVGLPIEPGVPKIEDPEKVFSIRAPFDGLIDRIPFQPGSLVKDGDVLTNLSDNRVMWVYFNVSEKRYLEYMAERGQDRQRQDVELVLADHSKFPQTGKIGAIEASFDNQTGYIAFRADFPNPDGLLRHGQTGTILIKRELKDAIVIPQRATLEALDKRYVYIVDQDNVAHRREIVVQNELDDLYVLKQGVGAGEKIVVDGVKQVRDGDKVK